MSENFFKFHFQEPEVEDFADSTCWRILNFLHLSGKEKYYESAQIMVQKIELRIITSIAKKEESISIRIEFSARFLRVVLKDCFA